MTAHKHYKLMAQYAQDAAETNKPWERWESADSSDKWDPLYETPHWHEQLKYRRKPRTLTYTVTIPEPMREAPEVGESYYVASLRAEDLYMAFEWAGHEIDMRWLKRGLCFATAEDAIAAAKAMLPIKGEEV